MSSFGLRALACVVVVAAGACVLRLSDKNAPLPNGSVTGAAANCGAVQVPAHGAPGGNPEVKLVGRFDVRDPQSIRFDWSGNEISARFEGPQVSARLEAENQDVLFTAVVDGKVIDPRIRVVSAATPGAKVPVSYLIAQGLGGGAHEVVLHRDTEAQNGVIIFHGFDFGGGHLLAPTRRARRIELIGDSITCGFGDEGVDATCPYTIETQNQYLAYGSIVGRMLDADVVTECWSGKGLAKNYRDLPTSPETMPQLWRERTLGSLPNPGMPPKPGDPVDPALGLAWDFASEPEPQVVVVNLGTNDYSRDVENNNTRQLVEGGADGDGNPDPDFDPVLFHNTYVSFLKDVRARRPHAQIFITVPPMISDQFPRDNARTQMWDDLVSITSELARAGDNAVYAMQLIDMGTRYGLGCNYHPNLRVHEIMADQLAGAIRSKTCWD